MRPYLMKKRGALWQVRFAGETTFHTTGQSTREKAERWVLQRIGKTRTGKTPTLRTYTEDFFVWERCPWVRGQLAMQRPISQATVKMRRGHLVNHVWPRWGAAPLGASTSRLLLDWLVGLELSGQTRNHLRYTLSIVYERAVLDELLQANPMDRVPAFGDDSKHHDAFTAAELKLLFPFDVAELVRIWGEPRWAAMHYLMVTTGMRVGEAAALIWRHVYLPQYAVVIRQAVKASGGIGPPKNGEARAALFPRRARAVLAWWREQSPLLDPDDYVFPGSDGRYLDPKTVQRVITGRAIYGKRTEGALDRAGIDRGDRSLSCHSLRVTYNTVMRPLLPEAVLRYIMGHKTRAMTDRYDGSAPEDRIKSLLQPARAQIEQAWR